MRHVNAVVIGLFPRRPDREAQFHKQVAIHDFYFGHPRVAGPAGKLGAIQQLSTPPAELVKAHLPRLFGRSGRDDAAPRDGPAGHGRGPAALRERR